MNHSSSQQVTFAAQSLHYLQTSVTDDVNITVLLEVSKLLHLPEEAALVLRNHELSMAGDWQGWLDSVSCNVKDHLTTHPELW